MRGHNFLLFLWATTCKHTINPKRGQMQLRACHTLLYIADKNRTEKGEKREWKRKLAPLFHHNIEEEVCLWQMGYSQLQEAINRMSTVLLAITCSIRGVFKCLDCRHYLFFVTIYYQNTRSTWECSDHCSCQAELAAWLSEFIFLQLIPFYWAHIQRDGKFCFWLAIDSRA